MVAERGKWILVLFFTQAAAVHPLGRQDDLRCLYLFIVCPEALELNLDPVLVS